MVGWWLYDMIWYDMIWYGVILSNMNQFLNWAMITTHPNFHQEISAPRAGGTPRISGLNPMEILLNDIPSSRPHPFNNPIKHPMKSHWNQHFCWLNQVKPPDVHLFFFFTNLRNIGTRNLQHPGLFGWQCTCGGEVRGGSWTAFFLSEKAWENGRTLGFSVAIMDLWIWLQTWQT